MKGASARIGVAGSLRVLALLGLPCACGDGQPREGERLRLWTLEAELLPAPAPAEPRVVFVEDFAALEPRWSPIFFPGRSDAAEDPRFGARLETEAGSGRGFLRLSGRHGGLAARIEVEPSTCYVFSGEVRATGLEPEGQGFRGASFYLGEAGADAPLAELLERPDSLSAGTFLPSALGREGWQACERVFVTGPHTRYLHLVCSLATGETVRAGAADFAGLRLARGSLATQWRHALARAIAARAGVEPPSADWQRARRLCTLVGGEHRPGFVLLPGDRLRFTLELPACAPRLAFGLGPWSGAALAPTAGSSALVIVPGPEAGEDAEAAVHGFVHGLYTYSLPFDPAAVRWEGFELDLSSLAGRTATLELELRGDLPLAVGAPLVRATAPRPEGPNVLLVSIDTLRADRVGAYGYPGGNTPALDRLAREGVLFRDASAQAPYTLPSHATLLTGQLPSVHGVVAHENTLSAARSAPLAEVLARAGYATQAFAAGGFVNRAFGLDLGFEGFTEVDPLRGRDSHHFRQLCARHGEERAARLIEEHGFEAVLRWLAEHASERSFLFLHTYAVHDYDAPERLLPCRELGCQRPALVPRTRTAEQAAAFTAEQRAHLLHLYDAALRQVDERLGELLARLEELGLSANTLVIVTSDHGEEFFEHGALQHGRTLYEELLRVPLVMRGPGLVPRVVERPVMLADVAPTVLARLDLAHDPRMQGVDVLGRAWPSRPIWSEVDDRFAHKYARREEGGLKLIHGPPAPGVMFPNQRAWELYDLALDPSERADLAHGDPAALAPARTALERQRALLEELGRSLGEPGRGEIDEGTRKELEELGYGGE